MVSIRKSIPGDELRPGLDVLRGLEDNVSAGDLPEAADVSAVVAVAVEEPHPVAPSVPTPGQPRLVHDLVVASPVDAANLKGTGWMKNHRGFEGLDMAFAFGLRGFHK